MGEQNELMSRLLAFYSSRYNGKNLEDKFNNACEDLINTGDIKRATYIKFCVDNDIEPKIRIIKPPTSSNDSGYTYDSCGSGRSSRSSC